MLQYVALLFPCGFILRMVLPLHLVQLHHIVPCHFPFHPGFWHGAQYKSNLVGGEALQFPQLHQGPTNISLTRKHGRHYALLTKYPGAGYRRQQNHTRPKSCKVQHSEGLASHGHQINAPLSWVILWDTHDRQLQIAKAFFACPHKFSDGFELPSNGSQ